MSTFDGLLARVLAYAAEPGTSVIGIAGAPGAGKSTLTRRWSRPRGYVSVPTRSPTCRWTDFTSPMWSCAGWTGWTARGRPTRFDVAGYAALLRRIRARTEAVYAPGFERDIEQSDRRRHSGVPGCGRGAHRRATICCSTIPGWSAVAARDRRNLVLRSTRRCAGRSVWWPVTLRSASGQMRRGAWVAEVDEPNARLVAGTAVRADLSASVDTVPGPVMPTSH